MIRPSNVRVVHLFLSCLHLQGYFLCWITIHWLCMFCIIQCRQFSAFRILKPTIFSCKLFYLQKEYIRGISAWNFNLEDLKSQAALVSIYILLVSDFIFFNMVENLCIIIMYHLTNYVLPSDSRWWHAKFGKAWYG